MHFDLVVITPGVLKKESFLGDFSASAYLLLNPLFQSQWVSLNENSVLTEEDFIQAEDFIFNENAYQMASEWSHAPALRQLFTHQGIFLGDIPYRSLVYFFTGIIKATLILSRAAKKFEGKRWLIIDDGSYWSAIAQLTAQKSKVSFELRKAVIEAPREKKTSKKILKSLLIRAADFLQRIAHPAQKGGLLVSGAFRFMWPWVRSARRITYLRTEFDLHNFKKYFKNKVFHIKANTSGIVLNQFPSRENWRIAIQSASDLPEFHFQNLNLGEIVREDLQALSYREISESAALIPKLRDILDSTRPEAVLFDEEVCVFNKTLAKVSVEKNIPCFCQLHGVPFFKVSFMPSSSHGVLLWGESTRRRFLEWGMPDHQIKVIGAPQYGSWQTSAIPSFPEKSSEKLILLMATQPFHTNEDPDFIGSFLTEKLIADSIHFCAEFLKRDTQAEIIIKLHPRDLFVEWNKNLLAALPQAIRNRIRLTQFEDTQSLILESHGVLTMGSTVFYEALLLKRPVFILDYQSRNQTSFMSPECLDLENIEVSAATFQSQCRRNDWLQTELEKQQQNMNYHFFMENQDFMSEFENVLAEAKESHRRMNVVC